MVSLRPSWSHFLASAYTDLFPFPMRRSSPGSSMATSGPPPASQQAWISSRHGWTTSLVHFLPSPAGHLFPRFPTRLLTQTLLSPPSASRHRFRMLSLHVCRSRHRSQDPRRDGVFGASRREGRRVGGVSWVGLRRRRVREREGEGGKVGFRVYDAFRGTRVFDERREEETRRKL